MEKSHGPEAKKSRNDCSLRLFMLSSAEWTGLNELAEWTGLEPATPGVTGRYSNQLNYHSWQTAFHLHSHAGQVP